jgi:serine/threonine protein kinase
MVGVVLSLVALASLATQLPTVDESRLAEQEMTAIEKTASDVKSNVESLDMRLASMVGDTPDGPRSSDGEIDVKHLKFCTDSCYVGTGALEAMREMHVHQGGDVVRDHEEEDEDVNTVARNKFQLIRRLGAGGFKTIHTAYYGASMRDVAVGVISGRNGKYLQSSELSMIRKEIAVQEAVREHKIGGRHACRNFVPRLIGVHEQLGSVKGKMFQQVRTYYVVMELAHGDLTKFWTTYKENKAIGSALQMVYGLVCTHKAGYIHKDIKPLNTLVSPDGVHIWTADFGLAQKNSILNLNLGDESGTASYMPKELASTSGEKYDVYALGISFQQLGWGKYLGRDLLRKMTHRDYTKRPSTHDILGGYFVPLILKVARRHTTQMYSNLLQAKSALVRAQESYEKAIVTKRQLQNQADTVRAIPLDNRNFVRRMAKKLPGHITKKEKSKKLDSLSTSIEEQEEAVRKAGLAEKRARREIKAAEEAMARLNKRLRGVSDRIMLKDGSPEKLLNGLANGLELL